MGKSSRAYRSAKRTKELLRLKKQEEKRQRRLGKHKAPQEPGEEIPAAEETPKPETPESE
ncbi:MAG: hypothetical protein AB1715_11210 [Acidobacteriota bacterium]